MQYGLACVCIAGCKNGNIFKLICIENLELHGSSVIKIWDCMEALL